MSRQATGFVVQFRVALAAVLLLAAAATWATPPVTLDFGSERYQMTVGERRLVSVRVRDVPAAGLAAFQIRLKFDHTRIRIEDPNAAFVSSGVPPFAPLGDSPLCTLVRESATCPDAPWFLTSTTRIPVAGIMTVDNDAGLLQIVYGTHSAAVPPAGTGVIAVLEIVAEQAGLVEVHATKVILADNGEPPLPYMHDTVEAHIQVLSQ